MLRWLRNRRAKNALRLWQKDLQPPSGGVKLTSLPKSERSIYARNVLDFFEDSVCPIIDQNISIPPLFIHLKSKFLDQLGETGENLIRYDNRELILIDELEGIFKSLENK